MNAVMQELPMRPPKPPFRAPAAQARDLGSSMVLSLIATDSGLARARRLVLASVGHRLEAAGIEPEDFMQDFVERLLRAQASPASRYDPHRGYSLTTYLVEVGKSTAMNLTGPSRRYDRWGRERPSPADEPLNPAADMHAEGADLGPALARVLDALDLDVEREMAVHLVAGCSLPEIRERMNLPHEDALELRERVRALLLALHEG
jgi:DNA-directed RNA polymerase specialized sigma24 family protein